jgi:PAS domain S-box-containing protein
MTEDSGAGVSWLTDLPLLSPTQQNEVVSVFRRALVEAPLQTLLTRTGDGRILGCNREFEELLRVNETVVHGQRVEDLVHPDDRDKTPGVLSLRRVGIW